MEFDTNFVATILAIVVPLCIAVAYIVKLEMRVKHLEKDTSNEDPLSILKLRRAQGKISAEDFDIAKKQLE